MGLGHGEETFEYDEANKICKFGVKGDDAEETRYPGDGLVRLWRTCKLASFHLTVLADLKLVD